MLAFYHVMSTFPAAIYSSLSGNDPDLQPNANVSLQPPGKARSFDSPSEEGRGRRQWSGSWGGASQKGPSPGTNIAWTKGPTTLETPAILKHTHIYKHFHENYHYHYMTDLHFKTHVTKAMPTTTKASWGWSQPGGGAGWGQPGGGNNGYWSAPSGNTGGGGNKWQGK